LPSSEWRSLYIKIFDFGLKRRITIYTLEKIDSTNVKIFSVVDAFEKKEPAHRKETSQYSGKSHGQLIRSKKRQRTTLII
jgi:hypothetical protein